MAISDIKKSFGACARSWRDRLGISQEEVAERAGLHRTYVSDIERGARNPSLESISKLAQALGISIATFFLEAEMRLAAMEEEASPLPMELLGDILLVEDNPDDVRLTMAALKEANVSNRVEVVRDGLEALDFINRRGEYAQRRHNRPPQIVLLDLGLPKLGGLEVLRQIKASPNTRSIPVVVLTASRHDRDIQTSRKLGAEAYIIKPVDFQNFSAVTPQLDLQWALLKPWPAVTA